MIEIQTAIEILEYDKQNIENKITDFTAYNRSPNDKDFSEMAILLNEWILIKSKIDCIEDIQRSIIANQNDLH